MTAAAPSVARVPATKKRPGPAPKLSRESVLDAARSMRPDEVTLAAIGSKLGVTSPALYRYFPDRSAILEALAIEAREQLVPPSADLPWDEWLREAAKRERALWRTHPDLYETARYRAIATPMTTMSIVGIKVLIAAGFSPEDALAGLTITSELSHAVGHAESTQRDESAMAPEAASELRALLGDAMPLSFESILDRTLTIAIDGLRATLAASTRR